ncbi:hypothetical protein [Streptomyces sp. ISL-100]|uniref:hypothetical protein n=1 Tax=Streptomyces sp. ISL-100 TaxID=2819173 RepID=UPI001BEBAAA7|nr:hypothetical protein [Streptomyces sp. ISL-100]MBT2399777.1 hypothetical protein [Streptomyces sp. ISL-100]
MSWLDIDYDADVWLSVPIRWTAAAGEDFVGSEHRTREQWAHETAQDWWEEDDETPGEGDVELLGRTLLACVEKYPSVHPGFELLLYLAHPRMMPLPIWIAELPLKGDVGELRRLVLADETEAVEPPLVEEFATESLGTGLRSLNYTLLPGTNELFVGLRYAWLSEDHDRSVLMITGSPAPGQVLAAADVIAELAHDLRLRHDDDMGFCDEEEQS